jgi:hypothetical protein
MLPAVKVLSLPCNQSFYMTQLSWLIVSYGKIHKTSLGQAVLVSLLQVKFAMKLDLAGTMVWSVDTDDFRGDCINNSGGGSSNYPLMKTISRTISETLKEKQEQEDHRQTTEHTVEQGQSAAPKFQAVLWVIVALIAVQHSAAV